MKLKKAASSSKRRTNERRTEENLDGRYGKIGIPAVAAALPYGSDAKNHAYAPVVPRDDERHAEMATV
jgi:hypothetical protein